MKNLNGKWSILLAVTLTLVCLLLLISAGVVYDSNDTIYVPFESESSTSKTSAYIDATKQRFMSILEEFDNIDTTEVDISSDFSIVNITVNLKNSSLDSDQLEEHLLQLSKSFFPDANVSLYIV